MKNILSKLYGLISIQFGFDPRRMLLSMRGIPRFVADWLRFRRMYGGQIDLRPCLFDWYEEGGSTKDEYFWQDLYVARKIYFINPDKHVDIGSRIDGFVAHVACFRDVEVFDIRPITSQIPGVRFTQADLMFPAESLIAYCDSLSCLHALEHFGLGRYGDKIDPDGYSSGLGNMAKIVRPGGLFYLSVPIGRERVEFNAHRIFDPRSLVRLAADCELTLKEFAWISPLQSLVQSLDPERDMEALSTTSYALGIFTFVKQ